MKIARVFLAAGLAVGALSGPAAALAPNGFAFSAASNRFITPYGANRSVTFTFQNPSSDQVSGKIFDMRGGFVADLGSVTGTTLSWDGRSNGAVVAGGVYIYMIESMAGRYTGTVVVVR